MTTQPTTFKCKGCRRTFPLMARRDQQWCSSAACRRIRNRQNYKSWVKRGSNHARKKAYCRNYYHNYLKPGS